MKIGCPHCGVRLGVRDELRGKTVRCPECGKPIRLGEATDSDDPQSDEYGGPAHLLPSSRPRKKKTSSQSVEARDRRPRPRRSRGRSTIGMLAGLAAGPFWRGASRHLPYMAGALLCVGAMFGFLVGITRSAFVAGLLLQLIGYPLAICVFFLMCYPTSCFWKVVVGSSDSNGDIAEWPPGGAYPEWVFDMLFVDYAIIISLILSMGVGKVRELAIPNQAPPEAYWRLLGREFDASALFLPKLPTPEEHESADSPEDRSEPAFLRPGPGWQTTFAAFLVIFPLVLTSCIDASTPLLVPWSPRVLLSLVVNFPAWCLVFVISLGVLSAAGAVAMWGAVHAPFTTFTLCSPLAALAIVVYGRTIGLLSWRIASP
jgi:hypothetical protein